MIYKLIGHWHNWTSPWTGRVLSEFRVIWNKVIIGERLQSQAKTPAHRINKIINKLLYSWKKV